MDYPLENLGPDRFQQLCQSLLVSEHPDVQCFPISQSDGGRDAIRIVPERSSTSFAVYQVKYLHKPLAESDPHKWLLSILKEEAPKLSKLIPKGARKYYVLTNVPGTARPDSGSIDQVAKILSENLEIPAVCWWRDDINRRLDNAWALKWVYPEIMSGQDLLRAIIEAGLTEHQDRRTSSIQAFLRQQYHVDEEVRFKQVELQNKLLDLFIDVPLFPRGRKFARRYAPGYPHRHHAKAEPAVSEDPNTLHFDAQSASIRQVFADDNPIGAATFLLNSTWSSQIPCIVLEGAPGQGKSTLAQYVCQVHRMKLLRMTAQIETISPEHRSASIRLPIKVDLRDFATWLSGKNPFARESTEKITGHHRSLEGFLAFLISHQSGGTTFTTDDLLAVARISSLLIVLDGLDEVAEISMRRSVVSEIVDGTKRLSQNSASLQTIVTSRPAAFANSPGMPADQYSYFQLTDLSQDLIFGYAELWMRARSLNERLSTEFRDVLKAKLQQPHLRDLGRNPMQLAILLSLILTRGSSLPDKRTALYDFYMELFLNRESEKNLVVREHRDLLVELHRYLAWLLHSESEKGKARASISQERLLAVVTEYLRKEGYDATLASQLFTGMVERVVALVSRVQGTFEFEVQPLREYFAACFLFYTAPHSSPGKEKPGTRPDRFDAIARNFYWLNVTRFYAGCYSKGELPSLVERLQALCTQEGYNRISDPRELAITLLADWVFNQNPKSVQQIIELLFEPNGLRRLLARNPVSEHAHWSRHIPSVPAKCGKDELIARCFALLHADPPPDYAMDIQTLLRANADSPGDLFSQWTHQPKLQGVKYQEKWLECGARLGILNAISLKDLTTLMSDRKLDATTIRILCEAGRFDFIENEESQFDTAVDDILSGDDQFIRSSFNSILGHLRRSTHSSSFRCVFMDSGPSSLRSAIQRFYGPDSNADPRSLTGKAQGYANYSKCLQFVETANREMARPLLDWRSDLQPWNSVVETGRNLWGERRALRYIAVLASCIDTKEVATASPDLLDHTRPLCERSLSAAGRASDSRFWKRYLESKPQGEDGVLLCLLCAAVADFSSIAQNAECLGQALDGLDASDWQWVYDTASYRSTLPGRRTRRKSTYLDVSDISKNASVRVACILCMRANRKNRPKIYRRLLHDRRDQDRIALQFALENAHDIKRFGTEKWTPDLAEIRKCYARGAWSDFLPYQLENQKPRSAKMVHLATATRIADAPLDYPSYLVAMVQERCRAEVARQMTPVADVARRDHWFDH